MIFWRWWGKKGQYIAPIQCFTNFYTERLHSSTKQWRMTRTTNNIHEEWQKPHIASSMCRWHMCVKQRLASNVRRMYACMCVFRFIWNLCYWNGEISFFVYHPLLSLWNMCFDSTGIAFSERYCNWNQYHEMKRIS